MSVTIPHPDGDRAFPDDYLCTHIPATEEGDPAMYRVPVALFGADTEPVFYDMERTSKDGPQVLMVRADHDPVFLALQDMHYFSNACDLNTKQGVTDYQQFFLLLLQYDIRGYLKQQKTQMGMTLKEIGATLDWNSFLARLEAAERLQREHEALIDDDNIRREEARGPDGYCAVPEDEARKALRTL